jgi:hypothetical protein
MPGKARFSWALSFLSEQGILEKTLDGIVSIVHKCLEVNRDSTAIPAREKVSKKEGKKDPKSAKKRGRPAKNSSPPPQEPTVRKSKRSRRRKHRLRVSTKSAHRGQEKQRRERVKTAS